MSLCIKDYLSCFIKLDDSLKRIGRQAHRSPAYRLLILKMELHVSGNRPLCVIMRPHNRNTAAEYRGSPGIKKKASS